MNDYKKDSSINTRSRRRSLLAKIFNLVRIELIADNQYSNNAGKVNWVPSYRLEISIHAQNNGIGISMYRLYVAFTLALVILLSAGQLSAQADIWMKDCDVDVGNEPNDECPTTGSGTPIMWRSVAIWNRKLPDPNHEPYPFDDHVNAPTPLGHQNPIYRPLINAEPNYLYVRVRNRGNQPTTGTERLRVYWAKAGTGLSWPTNWVDHMDNVCGPDKLYGIEITKPRRNAARATQAERDAFVAAINAIKNNYYSATSSGSQPGVSWWDLQDMLHQGPMGQPIHGNPGFLPWHRELNNRLELYLRTADPLVRLLYWDHYDDPNPRHSDGIANTNNTSGGINLLGPDFMGGDHPSGNVVAIGHPGLNDFQNLYYNGIGPGVGGTDWRNCSNDDACWVLPPRIVQRGTPIQFNGPTLSSNSLLSKSVFHSTAISPFSALGYADTNEGYIHNGLHTWHASGSNIRSPSSAVEDPFFFVGIHIPVDKFWAMWQRDRLNLGNPDVGRIDPSCAYDDDGNHSSITDFLHPWDGKKFNGQAANVAPWSTPSAAVEKSGAHPSVVFPPIYDDAPLTIPPLAPGECVIIEIPWYPPNPADYNCSALQNPKGHICVLARIEEDENAPFGMTVPEISSVVQNTYRNNNIAWKNMDVVQPSGIGGGGNVLNFSELILANPFPRLRPFLFELDPVGHLDLDDDEGRRLNIFNFGRIKLHLGDELFARWEEGGRIGLGGAAGGRTLFEDDFNRANGILEGWTHFQGAPRDDRWQITGNELRGVGAAGRIETFTFAPVELPQEFELNFDMRFLRRPADAVGRHGGIMFCAQNRTGRYENVAYTLDWIDRNDDHGLRLSQVNGNAQRVIGTGGGELRDPPRHWKVVVDADSIEVYGDGEEVLIQSDNTELRGGNLGFWMYTNGQEIAVDNLQVGTLGGGEPMVEIERQGVLAIDCPSRTPWRGAPAIGINLAGNEARMIAVELELDEDYMDNGRDFLATGPLEYHLIQTGADGEAIGGQTYVVDLSKLKLVPGGSDWRYTSRLPAPRNWNQPDYNDDDWETTVGLLQGPDENVENARSSNDPVFFRHRFNLSEGDINAIRNLWLRLKTDDGAEIHLNGERIHQTGPLRPVTGLREDTFFPVDITETQGLLRAGENVLAVAIGSHPEGNDQLTFNLELLANHLNTDEPTVVSIREPADGDHYQVDDVIPIFAEAIDPDGDNPAVNYQVNGQPIRLIAGAQPSFRPTAPGMYRLTAGCSNNPATHTVTIVVLDNLPPRTELTLPGGMRYDEGEEIVLRAEVEDTDEVSVLFTAFLMEEFFTVSSSPNIMENGEPGIGWGTTIGVDDSAPYEAMVDNLPPGHYGFQTFAVDERGAIEKGVMRMATIVATQAPPGGWQVPGDFTQDGSVDIADAIALLQWQFMGGPGPDCPPGAEFNGDGNWDISDAVAGLQWLFVGGRPHHLGTQCQVILTCPDACNP